MRIKTCSHGTNEHLVSLLVSVAVCAAGNAGPMGCGRLCREELHRLEKGVRTRFGVPKRDLTPFSVSMPSSKNTPFRGTAITV
jgi:hypothetical protein